MTSYRVAATAASTLGDLRRWAVGELQRVSQSIDQKQATISVLNSPPDKPQVGMLVIADGTNWNPGSGRGLYYYDSSWIYLG